MAEKAIADGKSAAEAGAEAPAAAKAAGVSDERAKEKAGTRAADIAADEAISGSVKKKLGIVPRLLPRPPVSTLPMQSRLLRTPLQMQRMPTDRSRATAHPSSECSGRRLKAPSCCVSLMTSRSLMTFLATYHSLVHG